MTATAATAAPGVLAGLLAGVARDGGRVAVAGIDGRSGSGKTQLADALARTLRAAGEAVTVLSMDDVYPGWDGLDESCRRLTDDVLTPLRAGGAPRARPWNWRDGVEGEWHDLAVPAGGVLVVEGVGACCRSARRHLDVAVWVRAPERVRRARALARDGSTFAPHWHRWAVQERRYLLADQPQDAADVVVEAVGT